MLTPEEIDSLIETMQPLIDQLNGFMMNDIVRRLMARLKRDELVKLSQSDLWQLELLKETGAHYETVQKYIKGWTGLADKEIAMIFEDAGITAWDADRKIYDAAGRKTLPITELPRMVQIMQDTMQRTDGTLHNLTRTTAHASQQRFINLLRRKSRISQHDVPVMDIILVNVSGVSCIQPVEPFTKKIFNCVIHIHQDGEFLTHSLPLRIRRCLQTLARILRFPDIQTACDCAHRAIQKSPPLLLQYWKQVRRIL